MPKQYYLSHTQLAMLRLAQVRQLSELDLDTGGQVAAYRSLKANALIVDGHITDAGNKALAKGRFDKPLPEQDAEMEANLERIMAHHQVHRQEAIRIAIREYAKGLQRNESK